MWLSRNIERNFTQIPSKNDGSVWAMFVVTVTPGSILIFIISAIADLTLFTWRPILLFYLWHYKSGSCNI